MKILKIIFIKTTITVKLINNSINISTNQLAIKYLFFKEYNAFFFFKKNVKKCKNELNP